MLNFFKRRGATTHKNIFLSSRPWSRWRFPYLSRHYKSKSGRSKSGQIVCYSKGSRVRRNLANICMNFHTPLNRVFCFYVMVFPSINRNGWVALQLGAGGSMRVLPAVATLELFTLYFQSAYAEVYEKYYRFWLATPRALKDFKHFSYVSNIEKYPGSGAAYSRAAATRCRILGLDLLNSIAILLLPSGLKVRLSSNCYATPSAVMPTRPDKVLNSSAGYWRSHGKKPCVRGVAMNPVDHPNGGRTKSLSSAKTPWGFIAKKNK